MQERPGKGSVAFNRSFLHFALHPVRGALQQQPQSRCADRIEPREAHKDDLQQAR
jgi:hypothetical protein